MARWSKRLPARRKLEAVAKASDANVLLVGNSLLDGKIDPAVFQRTAVLASQDLLPLNAAFAAWQSPEQYLLFRESIKHPLVRTEADRFASHRAELNESMERVLNEAAMRGESSDSGSYAGFTISQNNVLLAAWLYTISFGAANLGRAARNWLH